MSEKLTEEEVKARLITPSLQKSGWQMEQIKLEKMVDFSFIRADYEFTDGRIIFENDRVKRGKKGFADYVLYEDENMAIAIIEAKDSSHTVRDGIEQAKRYALGFGAKFAYSSNGDSFIEFDFFTAKQKEIAIDKFPSPQELKERFLRGVLGENIESKNSLESSQTKTPQMFIKNDPKLAQKLLNQPYYLGGKTPRYYQIGAINATIEAIASGKNRHLIVMATGTGKTFVAFEMIWRLFKSGACKKFLYLADQNNLIDQTIKNDFLPLKNEAIKIQNRKIDTSHPLCFGLYHQFLEFKDGEKITHYESYAKDAFDFILVDECHRSSVKEDSAWREILEYFSGAIQVGMTATPRNKDDGSNLEYFGEARYFYGIKQGIEDGFLAPYKVFDFTTNISSGYTPELGKRDKSGDIIESPKDNKFTQEQQNTQIVIDERTQTIAKAISDFLKNTLKDRYAKTIVFCDDEEHAAIMREALINENNDIVRQNSDYIVRITSKEGDFGALNLEKFISTKEKIPTIATTSKKLSTGADTKLTKVIAIDKNVESLSEFTQMIGRGTRIDEKHDKLFFTILDFKNATRWFNNPSFGGVEPLESMPPPRPKNPATSDTDNKHKKIYVDGVFVEIISQTQKILGENGELITTDFKDFTKKNFDKHFASLAEFLNEWNGANKKSEILDRFEEKGILIKELRARAEFANLDEFDILLNLAFNKAPLTRKERAKKANKILAQYQGRAREILEILVEKYATSGISDFENPNSLKTAPLNFVDLDKSLGESFGSVENYLKAIRDIKNELYADVVA